MICPNCGKKTFFDHENCSKCGYDVFKPVVPANSEALAGGAVDTISGRKVDMSKKQLSYLVPLGAFFIVVGLFGPAVTIKYKEILPGEGVKLIFPILTDLLRIGFFIGIAVLVIGILRTNKVKGFATEPTEDVPPEQLKLSKTGITSFACAIGAFITVILTIGFLVVSVRSGKAPGAGEGLLLMGGFMLLGCMGLSLFGAITGTISIAQKNSRKVLGIIGLVINLLVFFGLIALMVIGATTK